MKAPDFDLPYIDKKGYYHLKDDLGKIIVLTFWASWCPDCSRDLPKKEQLFKSIDKDKVKMITINVSGRERDKSSGLEYTRKYLSQVTLADRGREVYDLYQGTGVPTTIIIDQHGHLYQQFDDKASFLTIVQSIGELLESN